MIKTRTITTILIVVILAVATGVFIWSRHLLSGDIASTKKTTKELYYCPMHPNFTSDKPGECPICGMTLVKKTAGPFVDRQKPKQARLGGQAEARKILFYRNPMNPEVTSPIPMKDQMGMDYVPVYEEETAKGSTAAVYISPAKQQLIGVKKEKLQKRMMSGQILTVGRVAYDPGLFATQQEYLQALKSHQAIDKGNLNYIEEQSTALIKAAKQKLLALGMSEAEIDELAKQGKPQQNLYLPSSEDKNVWVYITIYEYEAGLVRPGGPVKTGTPIEVHALAYPAEVFKGQIISVTPILESATRTLKARALVDNPENKLKLEMFVNVAIKYELGEKLAVPEEAVMHTGTRDTVFITKPDGFFEPRLVALGAKAQGYYEVLRGLEENEEVVTSGNFLIDSESKLNAVLSQMAEPNQ
jgi:multidrug efflux pump subunit AcrA (membrane-fusion protein)